MNLARTYAQVLARSDSRDTADKLVQHLKARGRAKLLPAILRELKEMQARMQTLAPTLEVAREADAHTAETAAKAEGIDAKARVNHALIRGWRARSGSKLIDRSGKRMLIDLYRSVTGSNNT